MKLKTKFQDEDFELGEVVDATISTTSLADTHIKLKAKAKRGGEHMFNFSRISELFEMFEDVPEEPKEHWCITMYGGITRIKDNEEPIDDLIEIGNYFNSKEDAYDAWDKLKAWKRLKDNGFRFETFGYDRETVKNGRVNLIIRATFDEKYGDGSVKLSDLDLLFCTEVKNE